MPKIHPSSVVEPGAELADDVSVGPLCYVGPKVTIGPGTQLMSHVSIMGRTTLGARNRIWPHATLGADPQDLKFNGEEAQLIVGDDNDIRESVTMHIGTANGGGVTKVGNRNLIMVGAHIAHDCIMGSHILMANSVLLAGHIHVDDHAVISGATAVHHFVTIGRYAFVGGMTRVVHDVPPFTIFEGNPAKPRGINIIGLERNKFAPEEISHLKDAFRLLFRENNSGESANMVDNIERAASELGHDERVAELLTFLRNKNVGKFGRYLENTRLDNRHSNPAR